MGTIPTLTPAGLRERIFAQLIDGVLLGILSSAYYYLVSSGAIYSLWISPMFPCYLLQPAEGFIPDPADWWWGGYFITFVPPWLNILYLAIPSPMLILLYGSYYTFFHFYYGQTPGKMVKGLVVLNKNQKKLTLKQSLQHWIFYFLSLLPLGAGFWTVSRRAGAETWHDCLAGTAVWSFIRRQE